MDMSLDDIIQKKKINQNGNINKKIDRLRKTKKNVGGFISRPKLKDARYKIIQQKRAKIIDARDKLAEITRASGDARKRLMQKQMANGSLKPVIRNIPSRNGHQRLNDGIFRKDNLNQYLYRKKVQQRPSAFLPPPGYVDYDKMEEDEEELIDSGRQLAIRLSRTVQNDVPPYLPSTRGPPPAPRRLNSWNNNDQFDPFDNYETNVQSRIDRRISPDMHDISMPKSILRGSRQHSPNGETNFQRRYISEPSTHLSYEMRSRLENAPDPHASMGIFSNAARSSSLNENPAGFRIVVSNLHTNVTQSDIKELFEDIGELYDSRIVRPGVAEVIYKKLSAAETAVETYHNRQLDGQPMKCLLVNPRASNKPTAPAIKTNSSSSRHPTGKTPLEIDIDALHKVLFRRQQ